MTSRRVAFGRPVPSRHQLTGAAALTIAAALTAGLLQGPAAHAATTPPRVDQVAAAAQCGIGLGRPQKGTARKARQLMAGRADLGEYGWFHLAQDPKWRPVSTLDSSGKGHMHSLHYLLPLLRRGVKEHNKAYLDRFYFLIHDWVRDNKPGGRSSRYAWGPPIYEGFRSLVLVCAAAGPRGQQPWLRRALKLHGQMLADPGRYEGVNNASLHQSMGLYAIGVALGRPAWRRTAIARERALAVRLIHDDGSDEEGALTYAVNDYRWFQQAAERLRRAGDPVPPELLRTQAVPAFIASATRPDGRIEALGDTSPRTLGQKKWLGTAAEYSATVGASGTPPAQTFASYAGGYVFGRSGWGQGKRPYSDETFYSIRAGQSDGVPHAHDDSGSLTLYSHGSPLLVDTGQWRYTYGTTRNFVVSRAAHNVVLVNGVRRTNPRPFLSTRQVPGLDIATVVDRGYAGVTLTRTVAYNRIEDVLLVWDRLDSAKPVRASQQWGVGRDRHVRIDGDVAHTVGPGANVSLFFTSGGAPLDVASGEHRPMRGWNSIAYGELSPSPSVRATQRGSSLSWLTVIAPRDEDVDSSAYAATASVSTDAAQVVLRTPTGPATISLDGVSGIRADGQTPLTPTATAEEPIVLAGGTAWVRANGLVPGAAATLESLPVGATGWTPVASGTAGAAGTVALPVTASATADYRMVSGATASAPTRMIAAVSPQPPTGVVATPTGKGEVTVTWTPPVDTGGAPLTKFAVRVDGRRVVVGPDVGSAVVTNVRAGQREAKVRAFNAVARSTWAPIGVAVPAYPSVDGPHRARKGTTVRLHLAGLIPSEPATLRIRTVRTDRVRTVTVDPRHDGTKVVRVPLKVRSRIRVVASSGGVSSPVFRITVLRHRR